MKGTCTFTLLVALYTTYKNFGILNYTKLYYKLLWIQTYIVEMFTRINTKLSESRWEKPEEEYKHLQIYHVSFLKTKT